MKISIIGTGYVGLVTGVCLAEFGHHVTCLDLDSGKIRLLSEGKSPMYEPGLENLLRNNFDKQKLFFTTDWVQSVTDAEVIFISVGTPSSRRGNGYADVSYVHEAARSLGQHLRRHVLIVNKSTVPVGTARQVQRIIKESNPKANFDIASNPEFLREGAAIQDFMHPDRIVIGVENQKARDILKAVYKPLNLIEPTFVVTSLETAELIKYASNAFLATKISFINEMANLCEAVGADVQDLAKGLGLDKRIGPKFLHAGPGYGGSCFPKDTLALVRIAQEHGSSSRIVEAVVEVNNAQKAKMVKKICDALANIKNPILAVLGLTFKPETDDMRDAPALTILPALIEKGIKIRAHDPVGMEEAKKHLPELEYLSEPYGACEGADAVCLMTEWNSYRALDLKRIKNLLKQPIFIDLRNVYSLDVMNQEGFNYISVGRGIVDGKH